MEKDRRWKIGDGRIDFSKQRIPIDAVDQEIHDQLVAGEFESEEMGDDGEMHPVDDRTI